MMGEWKRGTGEGAGVGKGVALFTTTCLFSTEAVWKRKFSSADFDRIWIAQPVLVLSAGNRSGCHKKQGLLPRHRPH
jgi:hypothetical protein